MKKDQESNNKLKSLLSKIRYKTDDNNHLDESDLNKQYFHNLYLKKDSLSSKYFIYQPKEFKSFDYSKDSIIPPTFKRCKIKKQKNKQLKDIHLLEKRCLEEKISKIISKNYSSYVINKSSSYLKKNFNISNKKFKVIINFKFNKKGEVSDVESLSIFNNIEEEANRVVSIIPKVIPGTKNGNPVNVLYSLPITFKVD